MSGESTGRARTPPVSQVKSVVQAGDFETELSDDVAALQLMNNHRIKDLVLDYVDAVGPQNEILNNQYALRDHEAVRGPAAVYAGTDLSEEAIRRRRSQAETEAARLSAKLDQDIRQELKNIANTFRDLGKLLNGAGETSQNHRSQIARVDAQVAALEAELIAFTPFILEAERIGASQGAEAKWAYISAALSSLDEAGVVRENIGGHQVSGPRTWAQLRDSPSVALFELQTKRDGLHRRIQALAEQYPTEYQTYNRILNGFAEAAPGIDWWAIAKTAGLWVLEEAAWIAAGVVLAPLTLGVGTALIASARIVRQASRVGALVVAGVTAGVNVALWFASLPGRIARWGWNIFRNAWQHVRYGRNPPHFRPGSQIDRDGRRPNAQNCPIGACVL